MKAAVVSDLHLGPPGYFGGVQRKLTQHAEAFARQFKRAAGAGGYDFSIQLGDLIEDADPRTDRGNLRRGAALLKPRGLPLYHALGNHDTVHLSASQIGRVLKMPAPYYSFQAGECRCIVLHSLLPYPADARSAIPPEQIAWLVRELETTGGPVLVFVHHSLADQDLSGNAWFDGRPGGALIENRREVRQILAKSGKVAAVINGHVHWNRLDLHEDIPYITLQSPIENFRDDGTPALTWAEIEVSGGEISIQVFGNDPWSYRFPLPRGRET